MVNTVGLILEPCDQQLTVRGNPSLLARALDNLVENAIKYTPPSGCVIVSTYCQQQEVIMSVADNGPGIAEENLGHVFDPFFTTREVGNGTGLGLSICHGIVTAHGGRIYTESKSGKGATFVVELPIQYADNPGGIV